MPAFQYQAVDPRGKKSRGVVDAVTAAAARADLRGRDLLPLKVEPTEQRPDAVRQFRAHRLSMKKQVLVTRQLATLVGAQVRIEDAIKIVTEQMSNTRDVSLLLNLRGSIVDGRSFAKALEEAPRSFDEYYRAAVHAAESAGKLPEVLDQLAHHIEERARNRQSLQLALIYPAMLALVSVAVIVALLTAVVPDIVRVFTTRGADLPVLTRGLIALSEGVVRWGLPVGGGLVLVLAAATASLRQPGVHMWWDGWLVRTALIGPLVLRMNAAQFSDTLATLVRSGVPLADALQVASDTVPNRYVRAQVVEMTQAVQDGEALSRAIKAAGVFPPMLIAMIASGEASGRLGESLNKAATDQAVGLKATVSTIVALVEPAVLLVMGGIVMLLVMAILMPIVGLNGLAN